MSCKRSNVLNPTVVKFELSYVGDSEANLRFIEKHGELVKQLNEQFLKEQFDRLTGNTERLKVKGHLDLASTLEIMRTIDQDILAYSKSSLDKEIANCCIPPKPEPVAVTLPNRSDLLFWSSLLDSNSFIIRLNPNCKDVIP